MNHAIGRPVTCARLLAVPRSHLADASMSGRVPSLRPHHHPGTIGRLRATDRHIAFLIDM
jgi:hypothetical protein